MQATSSHPSLADVGFHIHGVSGSAHHCWPDRSLNYFLRLAAFCGWFGQRLERAETRFRARAARARAVMVFFLPRPRRPSFEAKIFTGTTFSQKRFCVKWYLSGTAEGKPAIPASPTGKSAGEVRDSSPRLLRERAPVKLEARYLVSYAWVIFDLRCFLNGCFTSGAQHRLANRAGGAGVSICRL